MTMKGEFFMTENMPKPSGETPFKPEYQEYIDENKGRGSLKIQASVAEDAFPLKDVFVDVSMIYKGKRYSIYNDTTDSSGIVNEIVLPSKLSAESQTPQNASDSETKYLISAYHPGFEPIVDCPVNIFDRVETILPVSLNPLGIGLER